MNPQELGSLDQLRDIVEPAPVGWWPPAPGWWFVCAVLAACCAVAAARAWRQWKADRYRRAALAELAGARSDAATVDILKRTAIYANQRTAVGRLTGEQWCHWLEQSGGTPIPAQVAEQITTGVYREGANFTPALLEFARHWITHHSIPSKKAPSNKTPSKKTEGKP